MDFGLGFELILGLIWLDLVWLGFAWIWFDVIRILLGFDWILHVRLLLQCFLQILASHRLS